MRGATLRYLIYGYLCLCCVPAHGDEKALQITIAAAHAATIPWVSELRDFVVPEFTRHLKETHGYVDIDWIEAYGGSLYRWQDTLEGVQIGLADIGWVGSLWENAKLPLQNITYSLPFISDDLPALLAVINELHEQVPALSQTWARYNQVFLGASGVDTYHLLTNFPVNSLDDLAGKKILAPGTSAVWLKGTAAVAVDGALSTYYTQLKTGVADGTLTILSGAHPYRLYEVAPYITLVNIGAQFTGALTANITFWRTLSPQSQQALKAIATEYSQKTSIAALQRYQKALTAMQSAGAIVSRLPEADRQRWISSLEPLAKQWVERYETKGLPAKQVLIGLMHGLRARGVTPIHDWDKSLD
ncbi:MAG: C4-dicarboxylate TRAP transporter substrate-binding protein [Gammaproteobacteria bacterium]